MTARRGSSDWQPGETFDRALADRDESKLIDCFRAEDDSNNRWEVPA
jgi:hypothetical protein